jgi:phosphomannomutase
MYNKANCIFRIGSEGWKIFTGNELGALLGWWVIHSYKKIHGKTHPKLVVLSSTVSSAILKSMAKIEGIRFEVSSSVTLYHKLRLISFI